MRQAISPDKVWEGSYILDMVAKEDASIRPETVHGDIRWNQNPLLEVFFLYPITGGIAGSRSKLTTTVGYDLIAADR
jgi:hypothetical protein